ncbi:kelch repeat-containing protein [Geomesophilobacter sediminis]|uniref:Ig-like domain-containing protein n=1 Tax=Geomesophilobacter sediminis TaxID=2798584 RepID=A0A8J7IQK7_9BACT|nr:kelch repeat-containing protein [Geomesophilobacter sediminis]MBJ6724954.1 Ig-like domain-containing protein [Geomesophilobacter sediminis]
MVKQPLFSLSSTASLLLVSLLLAGLFLLPAAALAAPVVSTTVPLSGATGVAPGGQVLAVFSAAVDVTTINSTSFSVKDSTTQAVMPGSVVYNSTSLTATWTPTAALTSGTNYTATLTTAVKDLSGSPLPADFSWSFTTANYYNVTITRLGTGSGVVTSPSGLNCGNFCTTQVTSGGNINLSAQSSPGSNFTGWGGDCSSFGTTISITPTVSAPLNCTANFATIPIFSMTVPRTAHTATLLNDGKVLLVGGSSSQGATASAEIYNPVTQTFSVAGASLASARSRHSATLLQNGTVLVVGGTGGVGSISSAELYDPATGAFTAAAGSLSTSRYNHTATLLNDGTVLIAGGLNGPSVGSPVASAELFHPADGTFTTLNATMTAARYGHTATLLADGRVLIVGGNGSNGTLNSAEIYDPATGVFSPVAAIMTHPRSAHSATLLPDGTVLIVGGSGDAASATSAEVFNPAGPSFTPYGQPAQQHGAPSATLLTDGTVFVFGGGGTPEIYDPAAKAFTAKQTPSSPLRSGHTATQLADGSVLIAGGIDGTVTLDSADLFSVGRGGAAWVTALTAAPVHPALAVGSAGGVPQVLIYGGVNSYRLNPFSGNPVWSELTTGSAVIVTGDPRDLIEHTATALDPTTALIVGGYDATKASTQQTFSTYDFGTNTWAPAGVLSEPRRLHRATALKDGRVLISGGKNDTATLSTTEIYIRPLGAFIPGPALSIPREGHTSTLLADGRVLIAGGGDNAATATAEIFVPDTSSANSTGSFTGSGSMNVARSGHAATLLPDGRVLISGGFGANGVPLTSCEIFDPVSASFSYAGDLLEPRAFHSAVLLPSGIIVISGGTGSLGALSSVEVYDPVLRSFSSSEPMLTGRSGHRAVLVGPDAMLIVGGTSATMPEYYYKADVDFTRRPTLDPVPFPAVKPLLTGTKFAGGSEGGSGSTASSASNYPVAQLQRVDNEQVVPLALGAGSAWSATSYGVKLPDGLARGSYRVTVTRDGIPSEARIIDVAPRVDISAPDGLSFPDTPVGSFSAPKTITFANNGSAPFSVFDFALTTSSIVAGNNFIPASNTCTTDLQPGGSCTLSLIFYPQAAGPVNVSATLPKGTYWTLNGAAATNLALSGNTSGGYTVSVTAGSGGTVSPSGSVSVAANGSAGPFYAYPNTGYHLVGWTGTGGFTSTANPLTVAPVTGNLALTAVFALSTPSSYTVTFVAGSGGSVSQPSLTVTPNAAAGPVQATPDPGYHFVSWTVSGGQTVTTQSITISNVNADLIATANFAPNSYRVTFAAGTGGKVSATSATVNYNGSTGAVTATANTGYHFVSWTGSNDSISTSNPLIVSNVTADVTYTANFAVNSYQITLDPNAVNVQISGPTQVDHGAVTTYTFTPAAGTSVADITVNGKSVIDGTVYGKAVRNSNNSYSYTFSAGAITQALTIGGTAVVPDGVLDPTNTTGIPTVADAWLTMKLSLSKKWTAAQLAHADVAPVFNLASAPNGVVDVGDVLFVLWKAVNQTSPITVGNGGVPKVARKGK